MKRHAVLNGLTVLIILVASGLHTPYKVFAHCDGIDGPVYDLDSRYSEKRGEYWRGYKVHVTETCDDDTPHVITHVWTTMATDQDVTVIDTMHQALEQYNRLPAVHLVDGAYTSGEKLVSSQHDYQIDLMGPMRQDQSWQAHDAQAFDISHFQIDWDQEIVICPIGQTESALETVEGTPRQADLASLVLSQGLCCVSCAGSMYP